MPDLVMVNGEPNPTGTGRYCLAVCYCGTCPHYVPLPSIGTLRPKQAPTSQRSSWDDRDESTWIDQL